MFLEVLIDDCITPLLGSVNPVFSELLKVIGVMAIIYLTSRLASLAYNRLMVVIAQGTMKRLRDEMFTHMQTLPLRYFDIKPTGDIMSRYTNDTDTLRMMISKPPTAFLIAYNRYNGILLHVVA